MRLIFMGTPDFSVPALRALIEAGHEIAAVYCQPPRPAGRGHRTVPSPVHKFADEQGLTVRHPTSLKTIEAQAEFAEFGAELAVVVAYGLILPKAVLAAPKLGCLNIHASLLPRWRGAAPIQRAILAGDTETGVTIMQMDAGLDTGPMLAKAETPIGPATTASTLHDTLSEQGASLIVECLARLADLEPVPQPEDGVTYAAKLTKQDGALDWQDAAQIERQVRALTPWPGVWFVHDETTIRVHGVEQVPAGSGQAGRVLDDQLTIACAVGGAIRLTKLQRPSKKPMEAGDFLRGYPIAPGTVLDPCPATG